MPKAAPQPSWAQATSGHQLLGQATESAFALIVKNIHEANGRPCCFVARDEARLNRLHESLSFFLPNANIITLPAWDTQPFDRASPHPERLSGRVQALNSLAQDKGDIVLTTIAGLTQYVPPKHVWQSRRLELIAGEEIPRQTLTQWLKSSSYRHSDTVMEAGEFALRGSVIDIFPSASESALRIDLFGDTIESIRIMDPLTQRSGEKLNAITLLPASELWMDDDSISRFRQNFRRLFGAGAGHSLYEATSEGMRISGQEHFLPLFYDKLAPLTNYLPKSCILIFDHLLDQSRDERFEIITDMANARAEALSAPKIKGQEQYFAVPKERLYWDGSQWSQMLESFDGWHLTPFAQAEAGVQSPMPVHQAQFHPMRPFTAERQTQQSGAGQLLDAVKKDIRARQATGHKVGIACASDGSRTRLQGMFSKLDMHGVVGKNWKDVTSLSGKSVAFITLPIEQGFSSDKVAIISESDIFGERLIRSVKKRKGAEQLLQEAASLAPNELVVHEDHGIGRFDGLESVQAGGAAHDCLRITYAGNDRLFVPVENMDALTRHGSEDGDVALDKLGGTSWQLRKAQLKKRIKMAADELLSIAASRALAKGSVCAPSEGLYSDFEARFPYNETEDQLRAITAVLEDIQSGRVMDRLICGDVGFGKTEVAMRAAFAAAAPAESGERMQVALICPTTLLCRQHFKNFKERFEGFPFRVEQLSRLVSPTKSTAIRQDIYEGKVDIVIGTHALLSKQVQFNNLGMLIVDEEQNFGVKQKERLKSLKENVHVLTLSATPIPRTMQLAMSGIKELSLIATPPVDRLAVRSFVTPYDPVVLRDALMREHFRGGQSFYVAPRIKDLDDARRQLAQMVPELKVITAHGQMPPSELDTIMNDYYEGKYDILLATNIIESGLDIPKANTLIIHKAHMFGLAQLYQLRGRVGRSNLRAYAYFTLPHGVNLTKGGQKRLEVMQALDSLGAGFTIASHDMDIRGFGNMLGEEQTGHIKEVGVELYQDMLKQAIETAKRSQDTATNDDHSTSWSPTINLGLPVFIPEDYVADLSLRMGLYRRIASLRDNEALEALAAELTDRFGEIPEPVENLLQLVALKQHCRTAGVARLDAGPKGLVMHFKDKQFANPTKLIEFLHKNPNSIKLRADQSLAFTTPMPDRASRLKGAESHINAIVKLAA